MKKLAVDQDHVIADILQSWLDLYNRDYDDDIQKDQVIEWNWHTLTKESCGKKIYKYLDEPGFFYNLPVVEHSQDVLKEMSREYDIYIVTSPWNVNSVPEKHRWLQEHFPFLDKDKFVFTGDKSIVGAIALIDDKPSNLKKFSGLKFLFDAPHNQKEERFARVRNWLEIGNIFLG